MGATFGEPLAALVADADGTPLEGITVTFAAPDTGASATFANGAASTTAVTGADGIATSTVLRADRDRGFLRRDRDRGSCEHERDVRADDVAAAAPTTAAPILLKLSAFLAIFNAILVGKIPHRSLYLQCDSKKFNFHYIGSIIHCLFLFHPNQFYNSFSIVWLL